MKDNFYLEISSDLNYEGIVINIIYKLKKENQKMGQVMGINAPITEAIIAVLNQDKGIGNIEIKIFSPKDKDYWDFSYDEFLDILKKAKDQLIKVNKKES